MIKASVETCRIVQFYQPPQRYKFLLDQVDNRDADYILVVSTSCFLPEQHHG